MVIMPACKHGFLYNMRSRCLGEAVIAKTTSERVEKLRQAREELGLRRREFYAHDDDWPKLQEMAAKLQRRRERDAKRAKG